MQITVAVQNAKFGARDPDGTDRWPLLAERLAPVQADFLIILEAWKWHENESARLHEAAGSLGLTGLPVPASNSGFPPALLYRPGTVGHPVDYNTDFTREVTHGVAVGGWDLGLPRPLAVAAGHASPFSHVQAERDADLTGYTARRYGIGKGRSRVCWAIAVLDANQQPIGEYPDLECMTDDDIQARFEDAAENDPPRRPRTEVARSFRGRGFVDTAQVLHESTRNPVFTRKTGSSGRTTWILAWRTLKRAVKSARLLTLHEKASDHLGYAVTFDTDDAEFS